MIVLWKPTADASWITSEQGRRVGPESGAVHGAHPERTQQQRGLGRVLPHAQCRAGITKRARHVKSRHRTEREAGAPAARARKQRQVCLHCRRRDWGGDCEETGPDGRRRQGAVGGVCQTCRPVSLPTYSECSTIPPVLSSGNTLCRYADVEHGMLLPSAAGTQRLEIGSPRYLERPEAIFDGIDGIGSIYGQCRRPRQLQVNVVSGL